MLRGISTRHFSLLLFGPMLTETLSMFFASYFMLRATKDLGLPPRTQMLVAVVGSAMYALSSLIAGRWVTPRIAPIIMVAAVAAMAVAGLCGAAIGTFAAYLVANGCVSVCTGHYYTPFQINMTHVRPFRTLAFSVAFYNIAWGTGAAIGPLIGSPMRSAPIWALALVAIVIVLLQAAVNLLAASAPPPNHVETTHAIFRPNRRQWLYAIACAFTTGIAARALYATLVPKLGDQLHWSDTQIGVGQFLLFLPVPVLALAWAAMRRRLGSPWLMIASMLAAALAVVVIPFAASYPVALACCAVIGIAESCCIFHAIYYTNATPDPRQRARNVGAFEFSVGLSFITGPMLLGLVAWDDATAPRTYLLAASLLLAVAAVTALTHLRSLRPIPVSAA